ncbi:MAG: bifunctional oligoribonuclease/PAP phosphatase NrnA [Bacteroidota bacterium]
MSDTFLSSFLSNQRFCLVTHVRPDGDAIGSQLAMGLLLAKLGKEVHMINSDPIPDNMGWLPEVGRIEVFNGSLDQRERFSNADAVVVMDANAQKRLGDVGSLVKNAAGTRYLIDHHTNPESWFDVSYVNDKASSTGELVFELIEAADKLDLIDEAIASALYAAIVTDTGSFKFSAVTPALHRKVAEILERGGIQPTPVHTAIYDTRSLASLRLLSRALATITLKHNGQVGYMVISQRMLRELQADSDETDGFVNYVLSIESVKAGLLFLETAKGTKVSFRSSTDTHVNGWAQSFGGGGHRNASGAFLKKPLERTIEEVIAAAPEFIDIEGQDVPEDDLLTPEDFLRK